MGVSKSFKLFRYTFYRHLADVHRNRAFRLFWLHASRKAFIGIGCRVNGFSYGFRWD